MRIVARQLRLPLSREPAYRREDFVVSAANAQAKTALDVWRMWPAGAAVLIGPEGSGKTHMARLWAQDADAAVLTEAPGDLEPLRGRPVLLEDADGFGDEAALFHLFNMAAVSGALLMTSRLPPREWAVTLPDLRSRLAAVQVLELSAPDDEALAGMLRNLFAERNIVPADDLIPYLLTRMERSFQAARQTATLLDEAAAARGREVNRALAVQTLEIDNVINDLLG
jgi:chromosomal replication initiation ATPase DnaA